MEENFLVCITNFLKEHKTLTTKEIYSLFPTMNTKTVSWHLHKQMVRGNLIQASHGVYVLPEDKYSIDDSVRVLNENSLKAYELLYDSNFKFYLSGIDALSEVSLNSSLPCIICVEKNRVKDVQLLLMRSFDFAVSDEDIAMLDDENIKEKIRYYVLPTNSFELSNEHFALEEKAFVDLYYSVTRLKYPMSMQELTQVLSLIKPNSFRFKLATKDRHLSDELNFLVSYNRDFIKKLSVYL